MPQTEVEPTATRLPRVLAAALVALVALTVLMVAAAELGLRRSGSADARRTATSGAEILSADGLDGADGGCPLELSSTSFDRPTRTALCVVQDESVASPQHTAVAIGHANAAADGDADSDEIVVCVMVVQPSTGILSFLVDDDVQTAVATAGRPASLNVQHAEELPFDGDHNWEWCPRA